MSGHSASPQKTARILIADDDPGIRELLRCVFVRAGFEVILASNGLEAFEKARIAHPDVLITDLEMPQQEGLETLRLFGCEFPKIPAIAISGSFSDASLRAASELGSRAVMQKPLSIPRLIETVRKLVKEESLLCDSGSNGAAEPHTGETQEH